MARFSTRHSRSTGGTSDVTGSGDITSEHVTRPSGAGCDVFTVCKSGIFEVT